MHRMPVPHQLRVSLDPCCLVEPGDRLPSRSLHRSCAERSVAKAMKGCSSSTPGHALQKLADGLAQQSDTNCDIAIAMTCMLPCDQDTYFLMSHHFTYAFWAFPLELNNFH